MKTETRVSNAEIRAENGKKIEGYAAVFNSESEDMGFREVIKPGAFVNVADADIRLLFNHDADYVFGRTKSGTLRIDQDERGLKIDNDPPDAQWAKDIMASMKRGDINQMSFAFRCLDDEWNDEGTLRTIKQAELVQDVSIVTFPAYTATEVHVRNMLSDMGVDANALSKAIGAARTNKPLSDSDIATLIDASEHLKSLTSDTQGRSGVRHEDRAQARLSLLGRELQLLLALM